MGCVAYYTVYAYLLWLVLVSWFVFGICNLSMGSVHGTRLESLLLAPCLKKGGRMRPNTAHGSSGVLGCLHASDAAGWSSLELISLKIYSFQNMSRLIIELLYGTIPQRIGKFLRKRNGSHRGDIMIHTYHMPKLSRACV